ncbi:MAG: DUF2442 domain-containing protein [Caulobacteraceae bacterium]
MTEAHVFEKAQRRAAVRRNDPRAVEAHYDARSGRIVVRLSTGLDIGFDPRSAQGLETAGVDDLREVEITPSGLGLHFPRADADIYLPALIDGHFGSKAWERRVSRVEASRRNGKLGGRPKKLGVGA